MPAVRLSAGFSWDFVAGVAIFIAMLVGAYFLIRVLSGRGVGQQGRFFRVLDRFPVSRDCSILLLSVGSRVLAVCIGKEGGSLLCELDPEELNIEPDSRPSAGSTPARAKRKEAQQDSTFGKRFVHNMKLNMGVLPKNTPPMTPPPKLPPAVQNDTDFSAILQALQQAGSARGEASETVPVNTVNTADKSAADYRAAVDNMRRLAQTEAPAARPASSPDVPAGVAPVPDRRARSTDEETARELLRLLQTRSASNEKPKPANTTDTVPASGEQMDEILDKIAQRQSRYSAPKKQGRRE